MDEKMIEVREFTGPGYQPVIDFGTWRVAIMMAHHCSQPHWYSLDCRK